MQLELVAELMQAITLLDISPENNNKILELKALHSYFPFFFSSSFELSCWASGLFKQAFEEVNNTPK